MSRLTLLHRDLSRRIESLKQIVEASQKPRKDGGRTSGDMHSIDLNPNTKQLILKHAKANPKPNPQRGESLDEGFESDVDTISLVSTESTISLLAKSRESDSANGSASSDSDDSDGKNQAFSSLDAGQTELPARSQRSEVTECFNLVNCVCYTDSAHPDVLILVVTPDNREEETLVFKFNDRKQLEAFHENFSTVKAVANQTSSSYGCKPFNLLQRTDADGMTHIRISRQEDETDSEEFASLISLPNVSEAARPRFEKFATMGKPPRRRVLKKSKSIEDFLDADKPLRKIWNSAENILDVGALEQKEVKPKAPPRKGRKKGPAPPPPTLAPRANPHPQTDPALAQNRNLSKSFTDLLGNDDRSSLGLGNVFQGQFVRVQVDHSRSQSNYPLLMNFRQRTTPEIIKYESSERINKARVKNFDAFKFSDPKNVSGYHLNAPPVKNHVQDKTHKKSGFSALKLYIPMYKSVKKAAPASGNPPGPAPGHTTSGTFTNRLFGMSSKLKEFGSLQSGCNPNKRYDHDVQVNPYGKPVASGDRGHDGRFLGKLGRMGRSGSLGNLTLLAQSDKVQSNTLKSVIKKRSKDEEDGGRRFGRHGKKVTFSAYNTVQVV